MPPDWLKYELRDKWEHIKERVRFLGIREWVNDHPTGAFWGAILSAGLLAIIVILQILGRSAPPKVDTLEQEWYYDLNTDQLFVAEKGLTPPIEAPSGPLSGGAPAGVRAYLLSYAYEPNEAERFIGFLETSAPPEMLARWPNSGRPSTAKTWGKGKLIRRLDEKRWVPADSTTGQEIFAEAFAANEEGERPTYCRAP